MNKHLTAEASQSRLRLIAAKNAWVSDAGKALEPTNSAAYIDLFRYEKADGSGVLLTKAYPLTNFLNEATTMRALTSFVTLCQQEGIPEIRLYNTPGI